MSQDGSASAVEYSRWLVAEHNWGMYREGVEEVKTRRKHIEERDTEHRERGRERQEESLAQMAAASERVAAYRASRARPSPCGVCRRVVRARPILINRNPLRS